jgi:putative alpha-1,2-mannosidase
MKSRSACPPPSQESLPNLRVPRRTFLQSAAAFSAATLLADKSLAAPAGEEDLLQRVDPRIGTGGHGHCFPGAAVPFGAVQLSPDTYNDGWDWCSGYHVSDPSIMGFSHTHVSGTGCGDLLDFLVMAGTGPARIVPGTRENPDEGYRSRFSHDDEVTSPGYYAVLLKDYGIRAELSATERAGIHRYTFPASEKSYLVLELQHGYIGGGEPNVLSAELAHSSPTTLTGGRVTRAWGDGRHSYFALEVSRTPDRVVFYQDDEEAADRKPLTGTNLKCVLYSSTTAGETVLVKTGICGVRAGRPQRTSVLTFQDGISTRYTPRLAAAGRSRSARFASPRPTPSRSASSTPRSTTCRSAPRFAGR